EKKDGVIYDQPVDAGNLADAEEASLHAGLEEAAPRIAKAVAEERFADAMSALAGLRAPVDAFFDKVTVNCDDQTLRANRLRLLSRIRGALGGVADFSKIEG
ncbi:MAG TPA: DALR anticodon-binding domain-containing protein, partial [Rhodospirillales bacterium]|nr:DALR anticodon-binding domain-containing protein [Rhodospirillales bacterium]